MRITSLRTRYLVALGVAPLAPLAISCAGDRAPASTGEPPQPTATATATAVPTVVSVAPSGSTWRPEEPPRPPPDPRHSLPECPNGKFCVAEPASVSKPAPEFVTCEATVPDPEPAGPMQRSISFAPEPTKRERAKVSNACCYQWYIPCPGGRPLVVEGEARVARVVRRADWQATVKLDGASRLDADLRARLARHWAAEAAAEHASIAAFSRVALSLLAFGAPSDLVADTHRAALDEIEHARACFALASLFAGTDAGPGPLDAVQAAPAPSTLASFAAETFVEGCVGELVAALVLRRAAQAATASANAGLADLLDGIAADEERHAELAYRTLRWAIAEGGAGVREAVADAVRSIEHGSSTVRAPEPDARDLDLEGWGLVSAAEQTRLRRLAVEQIALPCVCAALSDNVSAEVRA